MATRTLRPGEVPSGMRRALEWTLMACVLVLLMGVLGQKIRQVQGQAEGAAIRATLGALRTALIVDHLQHMASGHAPAVALVQRNPFALLERRPLNYVGEIATDKVAATAPGSWLFDPACSCVAYVPMEGDWLDSPSGSAVVWFQVSPPPGPLQLTAKEAYVWQGERLD